MLERFLGGAYARRLVVLGLVGALSACGSGGGGSDDDDGGGNGGTPGGGPTEPVSVLGLDANGEIVDPGPTQPEIYLEPDDSEIIRVNVRILAPSNPGGPCQGAGPDTEEDYSGCTLADLNGGDNPNDLGDTDGDDAFDPELSAVVTIPSEGLTLFSDELEVRGASSRFSKQKSYKVEFDDDDGEYPEDWFRMERLQLNKHPYDLSRIRNKLAFDLFRQVDNFPSLRTQFVHVYVVDEANPGAGEQDAGLFTNVEYMDDKWARYHGQEEESNIFKTEEFSFRSLEETPELLADVDSDEFETVLESKGDDESSAKLLEMLRAVNDDSNNFSEVLNRYFNQDNFETWLGINILLANADSNTQNFYLYRPSQIDQFYFTPWDYDGAFDFYGQPAEPDDGLPRWQEGVSNWWLMPLVERYIRAGNVPSLTAKVNELFNGPVSPTRVEEIISGYPIEGPGNIIDISTSNQDGQFLPTGGASDPAQAMLDEIERLPETVTEARQRYLNALDRPMPVFMGVEATSGGLRLTWDESYDIQGDSLVYDVRIGSDPTLGSNLAACTDQDDPMPVINGDVYSSSPDGLTGRSVTIPTPAAGDYYMQVVVRDSNGYCQSAFDSYFYEGDPDTSDDDEIYNGVYGFNFDGTAITALED
ncbi:spore coat protein CotH [Salinisphaera shabanensis T35B1]|uniref:CotH kinase family protein n=1 Tax=Salinisphaera shabanensis TaxID=180542 RepID=UPI003341E8E2